MQILSHLALDFTNKLSKSMLKGVINGKKYTTYGKACTWNADLYAL